MERYSYPRTYHLPWSPGASSDDKILKSTKQFEGQRVIVTEKRDGENTSLYADGYVHARSIDGTGKEYQSWVIAKWRETCWNANPNFRLCGENLFARHSLGYDSLESFFEVFSSYDGDFCHDWDDTVVFADLFGFPMVPVLYDGTWDEQLIRKMTEQLDTDRVEGLVVRTAFGFRMNDFATHVAKWVRANHVTTDEHWTRNWIPNELAK